MANTAIPVGVDDNGQPIYMGADGNLTQNPAGAQGLRPGEIDQSTLIHGPDGIVYAPNPAAGGALQPVYPGFIDPATGAASGFSFSKLYPTQGAENWQIAERDRTDGDPIGPDLTLAGMAAVGGLGLSAALGGGAAAAGAGASGGDLAALDAAQFGTAAAPVEIGGSNLAGLSAGLGASSLGDPALEQAGGQAVTSLGDPALDQLGSTSLANATTSGLGDPALDQLGGAVTPTNGLSGAAASDSAQFGGPSSTGAGVDISGTGAAGTASTAASSASALSKILNGTATSDDWLKLAGEAAPGILGAIGSSQQSSALSGLANQYWNAGAPSRDRYEASMTSGFDPTSIPGYSGALQNASDAAMRSLSTQGNPYGNPGGLIQAQKSIINGTEMPAIENYQALNANTGGFGALNGAYNSTATQAIGSASGALQSVGTALGNTLNPQTTTPATTPGTIPGSVTPSTMSMPAATTPAATATTPGATDPSTPSSLAAWLKSILNTGTSNANGLS